jgi:hypothetical protein
VCRRGALNPLFFNLGQHGDNMNQSLYSGSTRTLPFSIQHLARNFALLATVLLLFATSLLAEAAPAAQPFKTKTANGTVISSDVPFSALERKLLDANSASRITDLVRALPQPALQNLATVANPTPCKWIVFQTPFRCVLPTAGVYGVGPGTSTADIGPVVPGCTEVAVGTAFAANTPAAGGSACYQFVVTNSATVANQVILPPDVGGIAELYIEFPNTAGLKITDAQSPSSPLNLNVATAYRRVVLMVRPAAGLGGQSMSIGIGVPAVPIPGTTNDDPSRPKIIKMNDTVSGTIQTSGQNQFYYFYPTTNRQTTAEIYASFPSNQVAAVRLAQRSPTGTFIWGTEIQLTSSDATAPQTVTGLPPTPTGSTTINGIMIRVSKTAGAAGTFEVRAGVKTAFISTWSTWNNENLTRLYDVASGLRQAFSYLGVGMDLKDADGLPVAGEQVQYDLYQDTLKSDYVSGTAVSDGSGHVSFVPHFPPCAGRDFNQINIEYASPRDYWRMTGQKARIEVRLPNAVPVAPNADGRNATILFYDVCSETYLGRQ